MIPSLSGAQIPGNSRSAGPAAARFAQASAINASVLARRAHAAHCACACGICGVGSPVHGRLVCLQTHQRILQALAEQRVAGFCAVPGHMLCCGLIMIKPLWGFTRLVHGNMLQLARAWGSCVKCRGARGPSRGHTYARCRQTRAHYAQ